MKSVVSDEDCQFLFLTGGREKQIAQDILTAICRKLNQPIFVCDSGIIDEKVLKAIELNLSPISGIRARPRLMIAGKYLEEQVTICALNALHQGFEVFLLKDFIVARDAHHAQTFDARLFQAGAVPTTLRQSIYEWMSGDVAAERRDWMAQMLAEIERQT